ncbi:hypothetical protein [Catellatospora tritici]|uniref:hypothetical protein n=1 Tax=Catellatospora tritici TaxID=2851566 RepID=UPI001C2D0A04|nr:hypothetical protein [Catellatospora tritici]MBV1853945.1 hypothetical protein [Catellatospora tritici]
MLGLGEEQAKELKEADIKAQFTDDNHAVWNAVEAAFTAKYGEGAHIEKIGFAKGDYRFPRQDQGRHASAAGREGAGG